MILVQEQRTTFASIGSLVVKLAETSQELEAAKRLRFEVFNLELQEGLLASYDRGYDSDPYDTYCEHLVVRDNSINKVVGTYRLLRKSVAEKNIGFYSENEFDLSRVKRLYGESLEMGRSCVAHTHRNAIVIALLWQAIINYAIQRDISFLFGCASLHEVELEQIRPLFAFLKDHHYSRPEWRVEPVASCRLEIGESDIISYDKRTMHKQLSPIIKGYLRTGALVCGPPAYDAEFGTADVFMMLEMRELAKRYRIHFEDRAA